LDVNCPKDVASAILDSVLELRWGIDIGQAEGGLVKDPVALCHQLRAIDKLRLLRRLGAVGDGVMTAIESCVAFTTGMV